jgi:hypothetical protein
MGRISRYLSHTRDIQMLAGSGALCRCSGQLGEQYTYLEEAFAIWLLHRECPDSGFQLVERIIDGFWA